MNPAEKLVAVAMELRDSVEGEYCLMHTAEDAMGNPECTTHADTTEILVLARQLGVDVSAYGI